MSKTQKTALVILVIGVVMYWALFTMDVKPVKKSIEFSVGFDLNDVEVTDQNRADAEYATTWGKRTEETGSVITTTK